jgi:hypothetical protein
MPLFFFEVEIEGVAQGAPQSPIELRDLDHAWDEGVLAAADLLREIDGRFKPGISISVLIQDEGRNTLRTITVQGRGRSVIQKLSVGR